MKISRRHVGTSGVVVLGSLVAMLAPLTDLAAAPTTPQAVVRVVRSIPKAPDAFTEGLEVRGDTLFESVGLYGSSEVRTVNLKTGSVSARQPLDAKQFAEGLSFAPNGDLVQLTWREQVAIVRNAKTLKEKSRLSFSSEGWGLCYSAARKAFVQSDGSNILRVRNAKSFAETDRITVRFADGRAPTALNELECEGTSVFANVWTQTNLLQIDVNSGVVKRDIDATSLAPIVQQSPDDVLNGIAKLGNGHYLLTGKRWPKYYEVVFVDR